jgi:dTDP-4-dehydrorhamnose reductase
MILLIGASSYIGHAFANALRRRKDAFIPLTRKAFDYTEFDFLFDYVRKIRPSLIINAEEIDESFSVESTETDREMLEAERMEVLQANTLLPQTIARVCSLTNTPWAHVSSGSIYSGAKVVQNGRLSVETDLGRGAIRQLFDSHPEDFLGYTELDEPNCSFKSPPFTFYSGTKALAEESIRDYAQTYIWRMRLAFGECDEPTNFLSQLQNGFQLREGLNSISHLDDCVSACLELWETRAEFGIYNVVNPGPVSVNQVIQMIRRIRKTSRQFQLFVYENTALSTERAFPRSECILDNSKLARAGVRLRDAREALEHALQRWESRSASPLMRIT